MEIPKQKPEESVEYKDAIQRAKLAEAAERFEDMTDFVVKAYEHGSPTNTLTTEGRNLFSVAFKNVIGTRRTQWRQITQFEGGDAAENERPYTAEMVQSMKSKIEDELEEWCQKVLGHIETLKNNVNSESDGNSEDSINYYKMEGDYNRYRAEYLQGDTKNLAVDAAQTAYEAAKDLAIQNLAETNPTRLGLMLNLSVFYFEVKNESKTACKLAKEAFDSAIEKLDKLTDACYKDSTLIMQLLRDNLTLWTSDENGKED